MEGIEWETWKLKTNKEKEQLKQKYREEKGRPLDVVAIYVRKNRVFFRCKTTGIRVY